MYTSGELERASMAMDEPMKALSHRIMSDIVRRIRWNGEITSAADWQITRLIQLGMGMAEIQAAIDEALGETENISAVLFKNVIKQGYVRDKKLYKAADKVQIPFDDNAPLQQLISAVTAQTNETMHNITQSLGFAKRGTDGHLSFTPMAKYYQETMDKAMLDISSGAFDYNTVLKRTVKEMTNSGVRTVDYATGWSNRVDVAARRSVMTGMTQLTAQVNEQAAEDLETDWFEISWHGGARPDHWWGGKWYTKEQLKTICKLGDVTGLCGVNCRHSYSPVIPGISEPTYTPEELEELNRQEQQKTTYNGVEYTKYEATQKQRRLETTMRAQREEMALLKEGGADEDDLINCRARYMGTSHQYAEFSKAMGLPQQRERVYADGLGNIMQGKTEGGSGKESPIKVPPVGAKVTDKVTAEERKELLSRDKVDIGKVGETAKAPVFTPAATIEDAEEKLRKYVVEKTWSGNGNVSLKGLDINAANTICETISNLYNEFDLPLLNNIEPMNFKKSIWKDNEKTPLAYRNLSSGEFYFNPKILKNQKTLDKYFAEGKEAYKKCADNIDKFSDSDRKIVEKYIESGRQLIAEESNDKLKALVEHEFGHHIQNQIIAANKDMIDIVNKGYEEYAIKISGYATKTKGEYIAESFSAFRNGKEELIDPALRKIFEGLKK